jgi:hypothetical protein
VGSERDPVRARRARAARLARAGQRLGYGLFGVAIVAFAAGVATRFTDLVVTVVVATLAAGSAVLIPAIIVGFGVRAAEREDRRRPSRN